MGKFEWSEEAKRLTFGTLKEVVSGIPHRPDTIALHGGLPPDESLPIQSMTITLYNDEIVEIPASIGQQQYNVSAYGYEPLRSWCEAHTRQQHAVSLNTHSTIMTDSSTHAVDAVMSLLVNPGDAVLIEEFTYCHFMDCTVGGNGYDPVSVTMDDDGIIPDELERAIQERKAMAKHAMPNGVHGYQKRIVPSVLYVIPTAQNPTGISYSEERRQQIYRICQNHDIIIVEDDPYHYLQFSLDNLDNQPGIRGLKTHSFLPFDVDGRVVRLDTFAKFLAPGFRLGWATGANVIMEKLAMKIQSETLGGNMISQSIVGNIIRHWGDDGLHTYVSQMQQKYATKATCALKALEKHMKTLAVWKKPVGGMFLWLKIVHVEDAMPIFKKLREHGIIVMPGYVSLVEKVDGDGVAKKCPYIRISFSHASEDSIEKGVERISHILSTT
jgi:kynurenine/2-aminoadipate aminotransferase